MSRRLLARANGSDLRSIARIAAGLAACRILVPATSPCSAGRMTDCAPRTQVTVEELRDILQESKGKTAEEGAPFLLDCREADALAYTKVICFTLCAICACWAKQRRSQCSRGRAHTWAPLSVVRHI